MAIIQDNLGYLTPPVKNWRVLFEQFYCPHVFADDN